MRAITGWRFLIAIVLPLALASLGAVGLIYDLLSRVESSSNRAENARNRIAISEALYAEARQLGRLTLENSRWNEAFARTADEVDKAWFLRTWGETISVGANYDIVAVVRAGTGEIVAHNIPGNIKHVSLQELAGATIEPIRQGLSEDGATPGLLTGFAYTRFGPAAISVAPISSPNGWASADPKLLIFSRLITNQRAHILQKQLLISNLKFIPPNAASAEDAALKNLVGSPGLSVMWQNLAVGELVTDFAWRKAGMVLGFMILVMTGIALVCWRLVQQILLSEEAASHDARHDHLTGLANRNALLARMKEVLHEPGAHFALAFADLDGFKEVNDSYGHEFGDRLICMVAAGIKQLAQGACLVSRMGGDEFIIMYKGEQAERLARQFSERFIRFLGQPFDMEGRLALVGASIGLAIGRPELDETEVLRRADVAMYRAKAEGKNRLCAFDDAFDVERMETQSIAAELKQIIQTGSLAVVFQPVVSARSGRITGVEALARWPATSKRQVPAEKFVPIAESSGLVDDLGHTILSKACAAACAWPALRVAVNISAIQLNNPRFVERTLSTLAQYGVQPGRVEFEITETSLIHDAERAKQVFAALQSVGIKIALDDFGTGFSSIGYLRRFQFDRIKIDKSIVNKVLSSPAELAVVQGVLLVARGLSAEVTAEGVENEDEVKVLHLAGCTELQGYHFHGPLEADQVSALIAKAPPAVPGPDRIVA